MPMCIGGRDLVLTLADTTEEVLVDVLSGGAGQSIDRVALFKLRLHMKAKVDLLSVLHNIASSLLDKVRIVALSCRSTQLTLAETLN